MTATVQDSVSRKRLRDPIKVRARERRRQYDHERVPRVVRRKRSRKQRRSVKPSPSINPARTAARLQGTICDSPHLSLACRPAELLAQFPQRLSWLALLRQSSSSWRHLRVLRPPRGSLRKTRVSASSLPLLYDRFQSSGGPAHGGESQKPQHVVPADQRDYVLAQCSEEIKQRAPL